MTMPLRAIGVARVSDKGEREGDSFMSPRIQAERMREDCEREGVELIDVLEEIDVSGKRPLAKRHGLREAVERIESGEAEVLIVGYFDRLARSLNVQDEVLTRVDNAKGRVRAVDFGNISHATSAQWLSATTIGMLNEYYSRMTAEKIHPAQQAAIERGVPPWPYVTPGYRRGDDGKFHVDVDVAPVVKRAYELRATGATLDDVRAFLKDNGLDLSYRKVQTLLSSRVVLGEIHFGKYEPNLAAHDAIVPRELWDRVQRVRVKRGRRAKSDRLLARLDVLRCETCGSRMVVGTQRQNGRVYPFYKCAAHRDRCPARVSINAVLVEQMTFDAACERAADIEGHASREERAVAAQVRFDAAQTKLDAAVRGFIAAGVMDEPSAQEELAELRRERDDARAANERLAVTRGMRRFRFRDAADREAMTLDERRALIRATIESVVIAKGGVGAERIAVKFL